MSNMRGGYMKKFLIVLTVFLLISTNAFAEDKAQNTYTPAYINHLKACSIYTEEYNTSIATGDKNSPYLKVKSTEEILGYVNSKCYTKSTVYSYDLEKNILTIKCGLTRAQIGEITDKMTRVNMESSKDAKRSLQNELMEFIGNGNVCRVKKYLNEDKH